MPVTSSRLLRALELSATSPSKNEKMRAQAIVILSSGLNVNAPEYGGTTVGSFSLARIRYGAYLQRKSNLPILVSGGRWAASKQSLATYLSLALQDEFKVPVRWLEHNSKNTFENARESARILRSDGIDTIYLVTHAFHMRRAREAFEFHGLKVVPAPTSFTYVDNTPNIVHFLPSSFALTQSRYAIGELVGRLWYHIHYY